MQSHSLLQRTLYLRPSVMLERHFPKLWSTTYGFRYFQEDNKIHFAQSDSLLASSFYFDVLTFYAKTQGEGKKNIELNYTIRKDELVQKNTLTPYTIGHTLDAKLSLLHWKNHQIKVTGAYRKLFYKDAQQQLTNAIGESILARTEYNGTIANGFLIPYLMYEVGSGQEQKRIYTYVEVPVGQGVYMWNDYNGDGVQQASEFEMALYPDQKKYIRLITPTNEYNKVNYVNFNYTLQVDPQSLWPDEENRKQWQKLLSRFSNQLSLQINNRALAHVGFAAFNPFATHSQDTSIIANVSNFNNTIFFNRSSAVWGAEYTATYNSNKMLLTYGLEGTTQNKHNFKLRWTLLRSLTGTINATTGNRAFRSALSDGRTYSIAIKTIEPGLSWILRSAFRVSTTYKWEQRNNAIMYGGEKANIQSLQFDSKWTSGSLGNIQARATYTTIQYSGQKNTSLSFVMLDALQNGTNWLWYLNWERKLSKGIELSIEYEGRLPGNDPVIHTGRMSIRALL
jgi:hypothetical protein